VDGHAHYTMKANHRFSAVGMRKSPGNAEAHVILQLIPFYILSL
jgi:hypothetical protein